MAALKAVVEAEEFGELPEPIQGHYEQDGDVYRIRVDGYDDTALKDALEKERNARKKLEKELKTVPDDFDRAELEELRKMRENLEDEKAKAAGDFDKLKERIEARHEKEKRELLERTQQLDSQLEQIVKRDAATSALADAGARVQALLPHVLDRIDVVEEDGSRKAIATGLDGEPTDISGLVGQMKEAGGDWDWGFLPNGATGGGSAGGRAGGARTRKRSELSVADKAAFIREHGHEAYLELPE